MTHAGRGYAVKVSREHRASVAGPKALGGWSESGSFRPCYDRVLPVDAMLGAAMFDVQQREAHFLSRESLLELYIQFYGTFNQTRDTQYLQNNYWQ